MPPSILYAAPMNLLDVTSGAARSMQTLLAALAARGWRAVALQAQLFDSPQGAEAVQAASQGLESHPVLQAIVQGVEHLVVRTAARQRLGMTSGEEELFMRRFRGELHRRRPGMVILYGGLLLEAALMREAREQGVPVVFSLTSPNYHAKETFRDVSLVVTDTQATADLYRARLGLDCRPVGKFVDPAQFSAPGRKPQYITFINPSFEKGVNVFMPLAKLAAREAPEVRFLVVEGRGCWDDALQALGCAAGDFPNVRVIGHQADMRPVYAATRALLLPSVWHESGGRVVVEALMNGIPVLASRCGGAVEVLGDGGTVFDLPAAVMESHRVAAPEDAVRPWLEEIRRLWNDAAYCDAQAARAGRAAAPHGIEHSVDRFLAAVAPLASNC